MFDSLHEECGVFGVWEPQTANVAKTTYFALYALQHRGQESCGIAVNNDGLMHYHRDLGLVPDVFNEARFEKLGNGTMAIGHVRYSTTGQSARHNAQPLVIRHVKGPMALAHNGNLVNAMELREKYELEGAIFHTTNDTETIAYTITKHRITAPSIERALEAAMYDIKGAYSLVMMSATKLIAARDPEGFRPLCIGRRSNGAIVFASESCALDTIGAEFVRDVDPGEIVIVRENGKMESIRTHCGSKGHLCVFEFVYFARPDSHIDGCSVQRARYNAGAILAKECPVDADVVIGCPDSGLEAAMGYARESGIPYAVGLIKNRYVGRTFIKPTQNEREDAVKIKLNAVKNTVAGKRVILVDDSIVRGTTSGKIVKLLRDAGAKEVHMRVSSPPFISECFFGTDIDSKDNLIACKMSVEEIAEYIGADSLGYLSVEGVNHIADTARCGFCNGCFTGNYPVDPPKTSGKNRFELPLSQSPKAMKKREMAKNERENNDE